MHDRFQMLPDEMLLHVFNYLTADELIDIQTVIKKWKYITDELLYKPDLITSLSENLSPQAVKDVIAAYKRTMACQLVSSISPHKRTAWQALTCFIAEDKTDQLPLQANAFFTVASQLPPAKLGKFITSFRSTTSCQALLKHHENQQNNLQRLCHALLCDKITDTNIDHLQAAIDWADDQFKLKENRLLLQSIKITLRTRRGNKNLPTKPAYYINLRGADLSHANLTNSDFSSAYVDLSSSNLSYVKFSHDKWLLQYILINAGLYLFCYIKDKFVDMSQVGISIKIILFVLSGIFQLKTMTQPYFTDQSNLSCVDFRNANMVNVEVGGCLLDGAQLNGTSTPRIDTMINAIIKGAIFIEEISIENINDILTKLSGFTHVPQIRNAVTSNILATTENMPKNKRIILLQAAAAHPFFSQKSPSIMQCMRVGLPLSHYAMNFFRPAPVNSIDRLTKALEEMQKKPENSNSVTRGLKRKFSAK